ncbi:hypothetical protein [Marinomonas fungiae]|uniref:hypothetical protein n=1 Tax=Marinomonas fungiae TaxID=1137284 RepID=UPI003A92D351
MSPEIYEDFIGGFYIVKAYISAANYIQICLKEADEIGDNKERHEYKTRFVSYIPELLKEDDGFYYREATNISYPSSLIVNENRVVSLSDRFQVRDSNDGFQDICKPRSEWDDYTRRGNNLRIIGDHVYACGDLRKVFRRDDIGEWTGITDPDQHPNLFKRLRFLKERDGHYMDSFAGFSDVDGFSEEDIYAGGQYDLWRYDGERWHEIQLPQSPYIKTVVCAKDGYVYVTGRNGPLVRGRGDEWEILDIPALDYNEMAWFDGKLWLASDYELGVYENGEYRRYAFPDDGAVQFSFKGVHACDEMLISYGLEQLLTFDGEEWVELIGSLSV